MSKLHDSMRNPFTGAYDPYFSEDAAVAAARIHKTFIGNFSDDYEKEAVAWTRYGYTQTEDPSSTALDLDTALRPDKSDMGDSVSMDWKWIGLHDNFAP